MNKLLCPQCGVSHIKRNGHTANGKQKYQCKECPRQCVENSQPVRAEKRELSRRLLLERLSLRGICRVMAVSMPWLLGFMAEVYAELPAALNVQAQAATGVVQVLQLEAEADEMWSFVKSKDNKQWIWIASEATSNQVIAFYVGDRSRKSARQLWQRIPCVYRESATFATDDWEAYKGVIPAARHEGCAKGSGRTNIIERFNCTLRQRVSRLVRSALSFSKSLTNHLGAIKYFICHYNLEVIALI